MFNYRKKAYSLIIILPKRTFTIHRSILVKVGYNLKSVLCYSETFYVLDVSFVCLSQVNSVAMEFFVALYVRRNGHFLPQGECLTSDISRA